MDENPDYEEDEKKQAEFIQLIVKCGQSIDGIDSKIIKRLCSSSYLKDNLDEQYMINIPFLQLNITIKYYN